MALQKEVNLSRKELDKLIDERVRYTTRTAYDHNQFLHDLFKNAGMNPHLDIKGREDLLKAYKKGVRMEGTNIPKNYADDASLFYTDELWTAGSSGRPKIVLRSLDDYDLISSQFDYVAKTINLGKGDRFLHLSAPYPFATSRMIPKVLEHYPLAVLHLSIPPITPQMSEKEISFRAQTIINTFKRFGPKHIGGGTQSAEKIPMFLRQYGFDPSALPIRSVIFGGESLTKEREDEISKLWGDVTTIDFYASTEGGIMAFECPSIRYNLHITEPYTLIDAVDEEGEILGPKEEGFDLVTLLYSNGTSPGSFIINYSHGDKIKILTNGSEQCTCGHSLPSIAKPKREGDHIRIATFGLFGRDAESLIYPNPQIYPTREYVILVDEEKKRINLRVETICPDKVHTKEEFMYALLASNPLALDLFKSNIQFSVEAVKPGEAYKGIEKEKIIPGKSTRVIRVEL